MGDVAANYLGITEKEALRSDIIESIVDEEQDFEMVCDDLKNQL